MFFICIFILEIHIVRERYKGFKNTLIKQSGSVMLKKKKKKKSRGETRKGRSWTLFRGIHNRATVFYRSRTANPKGSKTSSDKRQ